MPGIMPYDSIFAPSPATTRGQATVISVDEKGGNLLYGSGRSVVIRSIADPLKAELFTEHSKDVTVAKCSPSGSFVASGDAGGVIKIWALDNPEHPIKYEGPCLAGAICDIAWSPDSQRVCVVGDGRDCMGRVFMWDTGSTVGEIGGHSKKILSCDFKQSRPFQILTGSEDFQVNVFNGPPFKFEQACKEHNKFVTCVRYSPDGTKFCTVGSDMKAFVYDSASCSKIGELKGHKGTINSCGWSPDASRIVTASADKTVMVWDAASFACVGTYAAGAPKPAVEDMQVGVVWTGDVIISLSLRGELTYLDAANITNPKTIIRGHNKNITALAFGPAGGTLVSASYDGIVNKFILGQAAAQGLEGKGHTNAVVDLAVSGDMLVSCALDDTLRTVKLSSFSIVGDPVPLGGAPTSLALALDGSVCVVATNKALVVLASKGGGWEQRSSTPIAFAALSVAMSPSKAEVAVACDDNQIRIYSLSASGLSAGATLSQHRSPVTCVGYSPCGSLMASADAGKDVVIWEAGSKSVKSSGNIFHQSKITCLDWAPDSRRVATGGLDSKIIVWDVEGGPSKKIVFERANVGGIAALKFLSPGKFASAGADCSVKIWVI